MLANHRWLSPIFLLVLVSFVVCIALSTRANLALSTRANNSYWVSSESDTGVAAREITRKMRVPRLS